MRVLASLPVAMLEKLNRKVLRGLGLCACELYQGKFHTKSIRPDSGAMLANCRVFEGPVIFSECKSASLPGAKWQVYQFLPTQYLADLKHDPVAAAEEVASINVFPGVPDGRANYTCPV